MTLYECKKQDDKRIAALRVSAEARPVHHNFHAAERALNADPDAVVVVDVPTLAALVARFGGGV